MSQNKQIWLSKRYQLLDKIGEGGMGVVYKGLDTQTQAPVAIKQLKPDLVKSELIERFHREGKALRDLNHPNIVKMLASFEEEGNHYLVMNYVTGGNLKDLLEEGQLAIERILNIAIDLADALTRAHHLDIIHRDLKPANVLIAEDATPRLTDFGIARVSGKERMTDTDAVIGTIDYLAPEAFGKDGIDHRVDIWAFGVMLFEMLTGEVPFKAEGIIQKIMAISSEPITDLETLRSDIPIALVDLIYRMLEKDRNARIVSIRRVGASLEDILHGRVLHTPPEARFASPIADIFKRAKHNLPAQTTEFVGRKAELTELVKLLDDPKIRLVTILASGGMGKTRLALDAAENQIDNFANGVYFIELAPLSELDNIISAIADATGYKFQSDERDLKQQILDFLANKAILLVMDNFEHLLEGANLVTDILNAAPNVQILATSRQRLNQSSETVFNLTGLDVPEWENLEDALGYAVVKLFIQSAKRVQPQFELTTDNIDGIARICNLVQGMPLGILLAATWLSMLSVAEIAAEIAKSIEFLESDMSDLPDRHRSIRAVFDYSWNLMSNAERDIFMKLSIFRGGFTREAAQAITGANLRILMNLMHKSLILRDIDSGRYHIHELLRQYAEEHLMKVELVLSSAREQHCLYYADFLYQREDVIFSDTQYNVMAVINKDMENIRVAWLWACEKKNGKAINEMVVALVYTHMMLNHEWEGLHMAEQLIQVFALAELTEEFTTSLAAVYTFEAAMAMRLGRIEQAKLAAEASLQLYEKLDMDPPSQRGLDPSIFLCIILVIEGQFNQAQVLSERLKIKYESQNDKMGFIIAYYSLTITYLAQGKYEDARYYGEQAYTCAIETKNHWFSAYCLNEWGNALRALGDYDKARELYKKSYDTRKAHKDVEGMAAALNLLAHTAISQNNFSEAEQYYRKCVDMFRDIGNRGGLTTALGGLGNTMLEQGDYPQAEQFFMEALRTAGTQIVQFTHAVLIGLSDLRIRTAQEQNGATVLAFLLHHPATSQEIKDRCNKLKIQLDEKVFNAAYKRGKSLELETLVRELLDDFREED